MLCVRVDAQSAELDQQKSDVHEAAVSPSSVERQAVCASEGCSCQSQLEVDPTNGQAYCTNCWSKYHAMKQEQSNREGANQDASKLNGPHLALDQSELIEEDFFEFPIGNSPGKWPQIATEADRLRGLLWDDEAGVRQSAMHSLFQLASRVECWSENPEIAQLAVAMLVLGGPKGDIVAVEDPAVNQCMIQLIAGAPEHELAWVRLRMETQDHRHTNRWAHWVVSYKQHILQLLNNAPTHSTPARASTSGRDRALKRKLSGQLPLRTIRKKWRSGHAAQLLERVHCQLESCAEKMFQLPGSAEWSARLLEKRAEECTVQPMKKAGPAPHEGMVLFKGCWHWCKKCAGSQNCKERHTRRGIASCSCCRGCEQLEGQARYTSALRIL